MREIPTIFDALMQIETKVESKNKDMLIYDKFVTIAEWDRPTFRHMILIHKSEKYNYYIGWNGTWRKGMSDNRDPIEITDTRIIRVKIEEDE